MEQLGRSATLPFDVGMPGSDVPRTQDPAMTGQPTPIPGYMEPHQKCANCEYFDGDTSTCKKFSAPADMDGTCPAFEEGEMDAGEGAEPMEGMAEDEP